MPDRSDNYQLLSWPKTKIDREIWNSVLGDIAARLTAREDLEASFESLIEQGTQASLDYVQATIAPQLENLQDEIEEARAQIEEIIGSGTAPNSAKLGGQLPTYYASVSYVDGELVDLAAAVETSLGFKADKSTTFTKVEVNDLLAGRLALAGGKMAGAIDMAGYALTNAGAGVGNYIKGLITTRPSALVISVAAGEFKCNGKLAVNAAPLTKNLNALWAAGSGNGGRLEATALAANATYHLHAYLNNATGAFEWGYSLSATGPALAGYTWVGRFWIVILDGTGSNIRAFTQTGNKCLLDTSQLEATLGANFARTSVAWTSIPSGLSVDALVVLNANSINANPSSVAMYAYDGNSGAGASTADLSATAYSTSTSTGVNGTANGPVRTGTAKNIWISCNMGGSGGNAQGYVNGWIDYQLPPRMY